MPQLIQGEVPRRDDGGHSLGLVRIVVHLAQHIHHVTRYGQARHLPGIVLQEVDGLADVEVGLAPLFACFESLPGGQFEDASPSGSRGLDEEGGPQAGRGIAPGREGAPGGGDGLLHFGRSGLANVADYLIRIGRIHGGLAISGADVLAVNRQCIRPAESASDLS